VSAVLPTLVTLPRAWTDGAPQLIAHLNPRPQLIALPRPAVRLSACLSVCPTVPQRDWLIDVILVF
jgi:hypothetical protein